MDTRSTNGDVTEKPLGKRIVQLVVSITILTFVSVVIGYGGGLLLTISASLGGPDPHTEDGEPLRDGLLTWPQRNREFMKSNAKGRFPWPP